MKLWKYSTDNTTDSAELTRRLHEHTQERHNKINQKRDMEEMEKRIEENVMKRIMIRIQNDATPKIKKLNEQIQNLFTK